MHASAPIESELRAGAEIAIAINLLCVHFFNLLIKLFGGPHDALVEADIKNIDTDCIATA